MSTLLLAGLSIVVFTLLAARRLTSTRAFAVRLVAPRLDPALTALIVCSLRRWRRAGRLGRAQVLTARGARDPHRHPLRCSLSCPWSRSCRRGGFSRPVDRPQAPPSDRRRRYSSRQTLALSQKTSTRDCCGGRAVGIPAFNTPLRHRVRIEELSSRLQDAARPDVPPSCWAPGVVSPWQLSYSASSAENRSWWVLSAGAGGVGAIGLLGG